MVLDADAGAMFLGGGDVRLQCFGKLGNRRTQFLAC